MGLGVFMFSFYLTITISVATKPGTHVPLKPSVNRFKCDNGRYFDGGTGRCDECGPHCVFKDKESIPDDCTSFCASLNDFLDTGQQGSDIHHCSSGSYYDAVTGNCDPCDPTCFYIPLHEPPMKCVDFCREQKSDSNKKHTGKPMATDSKEAISLFWIFAILPVGGVLIAPGVIFYKRKRRGENILVPVDEELGMKPVQPENEGTQEQTEQPIRDERTERLLS